MSDREAGAALILALVTAGFLAALGISLLLVSDMERRVAANAVHASVALAAADAALERAIVDLRMASSWTTVPGGGQSAFADVTRRPRSPAGGSLDLDSATAELQSESDSAGSLGADTPRWRLFAWGPLSALGPPSVIKSQDYVAVWVADDPSERDGDPSLDSNGVLSLHAEAWGPGGARRHLEATLAGGMGEPISLVSWREVR